MPFLTAQTAGSVLRIHNTHPVTICALCAVWSPTQGSLRVRSLLYACGMSAGWLYTLPFYVGGGMDFAIDLVAPSQGLFV